jgi:hypothetical protein
VSACSTPARPAQPGSRAQQLPCNTRIHTDSVRLSAANVLQHSWGPQLDACCSHPHSFLGQQGVAARKPCGKQTAEASTQC